MGWVVPRDIPWDIPWNIACDPMGCHGLHRISHERRFMGRPIGSISHKMSRGVSNGMSHAIARLYGFMGFSWDSSWVIPWANGTSNGKSHGPSLLAVVASSSRSLRRLCVAVPPSPLRGVRFFSFSCVVVVLRSIENIIETPNFIGSLFFSHRKIYQNFRYDIQY